MYKPFTRLAATAITLTIGLSTTTLAFARPLNPSNTPNPSESTVDRYFRIAFDAEVSGDFDTAIINYRKAADAASDNCDQQHALSGVQAAREAKDLLRNHGWQSRPTQYFWGRLQELTASLPCVSAP